MDRPPARQNQSPLHSRRALADPLKSRLLALLRRLDHNHGAKTTWTQAHLRYVRDLKLPFPAHDIIREELLQQIEQLIARIARIEGHMELLCATWSRQPLVAAIMALRGFKLIASMLVVSEIGDFVRFTHPSRVLFNNLVR